MVVNGVLDNLLMKRVVYILPLAVLLISCLLLGSCGDNSRATAMLSRADSLMADRPDSALQILDGGIRGTGSLIIFSTKNTQKGRFLLCMACLSHVLRQFETHFTTHQLPIFCCTSRGRTGRSADRLPLRLVRHRRLPMG